VLAAKPATSGREEFAIAQAYADSDCIAEDLSWDRLERAASPRLDDFSDLLLVCAPMV